MLKRLSSQRKLRREIESLRPRLYRLAWSWCQNADLADDLVQEALLKGLKKSGQLRDQAQLKSWLCRILSNVYYDHFRAQKPDDSTEMDEMPTGQPNPEQIAHRRDMVGRMQYGLLQLSDDHRQIVTLVDLMGLSYSEVSETLNIPAGTVMSRLNRARRQLRKQLMEKDITSENVLYMEQHR
ncbi:MAG TPA: RNA polymerase sigma factor [Chromatiales bacterium]|nr:RNA polymerase sigma factor [Thiotrichales bacterium]HIP67597.1 RNA polymerase sigma factor [Chromatiales bacterium]